MKKTFETILLAIIFGFILTGAFIVFSELFSPQNSKFLDNFQGAFLGAFFAFLFVRLADALTKIHERHSKSHTSLIRIEHHLNDCGGIISDNRFLINNFLALIDELEKSSPIALIYFSSYCQVPINKENLHDLTNINMINDLFSFNVGLRKINHSMNTLESSYNQIKESFLNKNSNLETYIANTIGLKEEAIFFNYFLESLQEDVIKLMATSRILQKDETIFSKIVRLTFKKNYPKNFSSQLEIKSAEIRNEIAEVGAESREKINSMLNKSKEV